jgi:hypothetical protein
MGKGIPVPDNDWVSLNVRLEDMDKVVDNLKKLAVTESGLSISEWEVLNKQAQDMLNNKQRTPDDTPPSPPTPPTPPTPPIPPNPPPPTPGTKPTIVGFSIEPMYAEQRPNFPTGICLVTFIKVSWEVVGATTITLIRNALIIPATVNQTLKPGGTGTLTISVAQQSSFILKASNEAGDTLSSELLFSVGSVPPTPPTPPGPPPTPQPLAPPANFTGHVQSKILMWEWDDVINNDRIYYQFYASKTAGFNPDGAAPADMKYRISYGNQTNIVVTGAGQTWYGKVRQVARSGKSAFTSEVSLVSA